MLLNNENFILLLNKPTGLFSNTACTIIKKSLSIKKLGFVGTLDPFATGLMIYCANRATKIANQLLSLPKTYTATLKLGQKTNTADLTGAVIEVQEVPKLDEAPILAAFQSLLGERYQIPPIFSAKKLDGRPLYEYARNNIAIDTTIKKTLINIYQIDLLDFNQDEIRFTAHCSKGTYVRTLGEEIATALGTVGHISQLNRDAIGEFTSLSALSIEDIKEKNFPKINSSIIPLESLSRYH